MITILILTFVIFNKCNFKLILSGNRALRLVESDANAGYSMSELSALQPTEVEKKYHINTANDKYVSLVQISLLSSTCTYSEFLLKSEPIIYLSFSSYSFSIASILVNGKLHPPSFASQKS